MCGGCNIVAEGAGASLIAARYWWVARQGRRVVAEAEVVARAAAALPAAEPAATPEASVTLEPAVAERGT